MPGTAPNSGIVFPTQSATDPTLDDLADVPKWMYEMAIAIDTMLGKFQPWLPVVTQGTFDYPVVLSPLTQNGGISKGKVMKVGKQVYAFGCFSVATPNGSTGQPGLQLPYPSRSLNDVVGVSSRLRSAAIPSSMTWALAHTSTATDRILCGTATNGFGVGDLVMVNLQYETP